jgi:hypothetical protein
MVLSADTLGFRPFLRLIPFPLSANEIVFVFKDDPSSSLEEMSDAGGLGGRGTVGALVVGGWLIRAPVEATGKGRGTGGGGTSPTVY